MNVSIRFDKTYTICLTQAEKDFLCSVIHFPVGNLEAARFLKKLYEALNPPSTTPRI